jgi:DNA-binding LacI/PurR family transcriptional regulator
MSWSGGPGTGEERMIALGEIRLESMARICASRLRGPGHRSVVVTGGSLAVLQAAARRLQAFTHDVQEAGGQVVAQGGIALAQGTHQGGVERDGLSRAGRDGAGRP